MVAVEAPYRFEPRPEWEIYKRGPGLVLGFHGCDRSTGEALLCGHQRHLLPSRNNYDWLGSGIYFWESDPWRALEFARSAAERGYLGRGVIREPFVVGAIIDLGACFNLLEVDAINELGAAARLYRKTSRVAGVPLAQNTGPGLGKRDRDRAVIEMMHSMRAKAELPPYQTVRAAFLEGRPIYPTAGFRKKNHIQIAVRDEKCIKGYFRLAGAQVA